MKISLRALHIGLDLVQVWHDLFGDILIWTVYRYILTMVTLWVYGIGDLRFDVIVYSVYISDWSHDDMVISIFF